MSRVNACEQIIKELEKMQKRYETKVKKEKELLEKPFIIVQGLEIHNMKELQDWWAGTDISSGSVYEKNRAKLETLLKEAENKEKSTNEMIVEYIADMRRNMITERRLSLEDEEF